MSCLTVYNILDNSHQIQSKNRWNNGKIDSPDTHIHDRSPYWLGRYISHIYMISQFTGLVDTQHTYTWSLTLLAWLIHITHIHDRSPYWLDWYTSHIYMIAHFTGLVDTLHKYTWSLTLLAWLMHFTHIHDLSLYWLGWYTSQYT